MSASFIASDGHDEAKSGLDATLPFRISPARRIKVTVDECSQKKLAVDINPPVSPKRHSFLLKSDAGNGTDESW